MNQYNSTAANAANPIGAMTVRACLLQEITAKSEPGDTGSQSAVRGYVEVVV